ncbi:MAG: FMN-binding protein [Vallitaleaceae bacterium]|jgi:uncharacterized protein with FMN-binding domain|nr:FMN-binding protein [Vallitaleaceae bacterium]
MKKKLFIIIGLLVVIAVGVKFYISNMFDEYDAYMETVHIETLSLDDIEDGTYLGESDAGGIIRVKVSVEVKNHTIEAINLIQHDNGRGDSADVIIGDIVEAQSLQVDTITGATNSSLIILEAVQNALSR